MKKLTNLKGIKFLNKNEQKSINGGGTGCIIYSAQECTNCGGYLLPNGCCLGTSETHACLTGIYPC